MPADTVALFYTVAWQCNLPGSVQHWPNPCNMSHIVQYTLRRYAAPHPRSLRLALLHRGRPSCSSSSSAGCCITFHRLYLPEVCRVGVQCGAHGNGSKQHEGWRCYQHQTADTSRPWDRWDALRVRTARTHAWHKRPLSCTISDVPKGETMTLRATSTKLQIQSATQQMGCVLTRWI